MKFKTKGSSLLKTFGLATSSDLQKRNSTASTALVITSITHGQYTIKYISWIIACRLKYQKITCSSSKAKPFGDKVNLGKGGTAQVMKIGTVLRSGAYAPFTMSGTIVVSGVTASSYVTLQQNSSVLVVDGYRTPISMHWLAHVFQSPHRLVCLMSPRHCEKESYSVEGISKWVEGPLHVSRWLLQQNGVVTIAIFVPSLIFVLIAYAAEAIFFGNVLLLLSIICLVTAVSFYTTRLRKGKKASAC